jgi:hypothetical protein
MAETNQQELTPKEIALQHFTGKNPLEENTPDPNEEADKLKLEAETKAAKEKEDADKLKAEEEKKKATKVEIPELTDEQIFALASKKAGREIKSWDEFKPQPAPEDKQKLQDERDANKLSYGLQKGLFNTTTYESFIADSKDRVGLVYRAELEDAKKDDPAWDEDKEKEFKADFDEKFGIELDKTSPKYKRGQKQLAVIADSILKSTYAPIYSLDSEFGKYESVENTKKEQQQKILATAPIFKQDVETVLSELSTVSIQMGNETYAVPVSKEVIKSVNDLLIDEKFVSDQILAGHTKENLSKIAHNIIISQHFNELSFEAAKQYRAKHEKGLRGIPEGGKLEKQSSDNDNLTDNQKKAITYWTPQTVAN